MIAFEDLIKQWREVDICQPPFFFPGDEAILRGDRRIGISEFASFEEYHQSNLLMDESDGNLHVNLLPVPYVGNLASAEIVLLMLNPAFSFSSYHTEQISPDYRNAVVRNMRQENADDEYPFFCLNPEFTWTGGFVYWHMRLKATINLISQTKGIPPRDSLNELARRIAVVQMHPYHSKGSSVPTNLLRILPSSRAVRRFVKDELVKKALENRALILVARQANLWERSEHANILVFSRHEARSAYLPSRAQDAIARFLKLL